METKKPTTTLLTGTAGAIPVKNEKGEITMQKVKVTRYVAGKRPKYAPESDEEEEKSEESELSEDESKLTVKSQVKQEIKTKEVDDRRLKRLMETETVTDSSERLRRHRQVIEPEILEEKEEENIEPVEVEVKIKQIAEEEEEEEIDEEERARRRMELKKKALQRQEELLKIEEEEKQAASEETETEEESDYEEEEEEYTDSEDDTAPRLKPVFVRKSDRVTIQEKEAEVEKEKEIEKEREKLHIESVKQTRKIIEEEIVKEKLAERENDENITCDFLTDEENDENDYAAWKLRELKRIKRDRDQRIQIEKEKQEIQKLRNMTEEERLNYLKLNPKVVVNKAEKGKYKYLQKYYHRGAFFMDKEDEVFKRNFAEPTLEDHFDKTILPKVMQVKNFGMAGRTKYTHLLDQDTTRHEENPWANQEKFISGKGGGTKQVFEKPTAKKRK